MATTSPDNIRTPNPSDPFNLVADWAITASDTQAALVKRANLYIGTSAQRTAFTTAPEGTHWQDTNGTRGEYVRQSGAWVGGDTGWVSLPLSVGTGSLMYRAIGQLVDVRWSGSGFTIPDGQLVTVLSNSTIPAAYRPSVVRRGSGALNARPGVSLYVSTTGEVGILNGTTGARTGGEGQCMYLLG